jgi:hypothetical protein
VHQHSAEPHVLDCITYGRAEQQNWLTSTTIYKAAEKCTLVYWELKERRKTFNGCGDLAGLGIFVGWVRNGGPGSQKDSTYRTG